MPLKDGREILNLLVNSRLKIRKLKRLRDLNHSTASNPDFGMIPIILALEYNLHMFCTN
jgi:hypothetical protein